MTLPRARWKARWARLSQSCARPERSSHYCNASRRRKHAMFQMFLANYSQGNGDLASALAAEHSLHEVELHHLQVLLDEQTAFRAVERLAGGEI